MFLDFSDCLTRFLVFSPKFPKLLRMNKTEGNNYVFIYLFCMPLLYAGEKTMKINNRSTWRINRRLNCNTFNAVYMIECEKDNCKLRYKATGHHFNLPGHTLSHMKFTILEQVKVNSDNYRKERERYFIQKFDTYNQGLNRQR